MIIGADEPAEEELQLEGEDNPEELTSELATMTKPEISLNSVLGIDTPRTVKMKEEIGGQEVVDLVVMIDAGATHNFISSQTVQRLSIPITPTREFGVTPGA